MAELNMEMVGSENGLKWEFIGSDTSYLKGYNSSQLSLGSINDVKKGRYLATRYEITGTLKYRSNIEGNFTIDFKNAFGNSGTLFLLTVSNNYEPQTAKINAYGISIGGFGYGQPSDAMQLNQSSNALISEVAYFDLGTLRQPSGSGNDLILDGTTITVKLYGLTIPEFSN